MKAGNNPLRREKKRKREEGKKLTSHEDLQPGYFRWSVLTEDIKKFTNRSFVPKQPKLTKNLYWILSYKLLSWVTNSNWVTNCFQIIYISKYVNFWLKKMPILFPLILINLKFWLRIFISAAQWEYFNKALSIHSLNYDPRNSFIKTVVETEGWERRCFAICKTWQKPFKATLRTNLVDC